jgi:carboxymethylenebutenolidase
MLQTPDGDMRLYEAIPETVKGAVIVIAEAFGVNDHIEDVTRRAAAEGYHAVAPDLFHRSGVGTVAYEPLDFTQLMGLFAGMDATTVAADLDATLAYLDAAGLERSRIAITGFCWGGWVSCFAAANYTLGAAVTWYGGGIVAAGALPFPTIDVSTITTPWLGLFGELDKGITSDHLDTLQDALDAAALPVDSEIVRYAGADHGFHCDDRPKVFNAEAAAAGWQRAVGWLDDHLGA